MGKLDQFEEACIPYTNKDGFLSGNPNSQGYGRLCDNHAMFTAEYNRIRHDLGATAYSGAMFGFLTPQGQLLRYPGADADTSPDDYLGFLNFCVLQNIGRYLFSKQLLDFGIKHYGSMTIPWSQAGFMWRQPQLLAAALSAAGHIAWYTFWYLPLVLYTSLVIAVAGIKADPVTDQDTRRLSWHLLMVMQESSLLCRLAGKLWWRRLRKQYGEEGMRLVFSRYFTPSHPFALYAVNPWEKKT